VPRKNSNNHFDRAARIGNQADKLVELSMKACIAAVEGRTNAEAKEASNLPAGEAPGWFGMAQKFGIAAIKTKAKEVSTTTLNVQINAPAQSVDAWLASVARPKTLMEDGSAIEAREVEHRVQHQGVDDERKKAS